MKKIITILALVTILAILVVPAQASETQTEDPYIWEQEGDNTFCYIDNDRWSELDMLTGWHEIGGEMYFFHDDGRMAKNEWVEANDARFYFDAYGHLEKWEVE